MNHVAASYTVLIVYYSRFGSVQLLAEEVAEGARRVEGVDARLLRVEDQPIEEPHHGERAGEAGTRRAALLNQLTSADAIVVGAPSYFGSMASPVKRFFEDAVTAAAPPATDRTRPWRHYLLHDKVGAAFTASGTPHGGNEETLHSILTMLMHLGLIVVTPGQRSPVLENEAAPYGATTVTGPEGHREPTSEEQDAARDLGHRVAEVTACLVLGRRAWHENAGKERPALAASPLEQSHLRPSFERRR